MPRPTKITTTVPELKGKVLKAVVGLITPAKGKTVGPREVEVVTKYLDVYTKMIDPHGNENAGPPRTVLEAMDRLGMNGASWDAWRAAATMLDPVAQYSPLDREVINERTGDPPPEDIVREFWGVIGRRGGKSQFAAIAAVVWACRKYPGVTNPEVAIIARSRDQAHVSARYAREVAEKLGVLGANPSMEVVPIKGGCTIRVMANSPSIRGRANVAAILDEVAHYDTSPNAAWSDRDLYTALSPSLATIRAPLLLAVSSPWRRQGILAEAYEKWQNGERQEGRVVWHGSTRAMNPTMTEARINREIELNPAVEHEFAATFFTDGGAWLPPHVTEGWEKWNPLPFPIGENHGPLYAFCDASGGGGKDSFALAIAERMDGDVSARIVDIMLIDPPFDPEKVVADAAHRLRQFHVPSVTGDRFAPGFLNAAWERYGVAYKESKVSKSGIYNAVLPAMLSGRVEFVRNETLVEQLRGLVETGGRTPPPTIDHRPGEHDDLANACCGALMLALEPEQTVGVVRGTRVSF